MKIRKLDHVNLRTTQLDVMTEWYTNVLGLTSGSRPSFPFPGAWLYAGGVVVAHLVEVEEVCVGAEVPLKLEHFAFSATGRAAFEARLKEVGQEYRSKSIEDIGIIQVNVWDPDGNHIHVDFAADE